MSIENAIITRAQPHILASRMEALIREEITKGCSPVLSMFPVRLEPEFQLLHPGISEAALLRSMQVPEEPLNWADWARHRIWISPKQPFDWNRSELFLKQLSGASHRIGFEVAGHQERIELTLLVHREDVPIVETAFAGEFEHCRLMLAMNPLLETLAASHTQFYDFYPPPPYFHLLTAFEELKTSPLESLLCALQQVPSPAIGFYQCLFQPVRHHWHPNVELLHDLEYRLKLQTGAGSAYLQQVPSGDLRDIAQKVERKAHTDKPFFAAAVRIGIAHEKPLPQLLALATCMTLFRHGGQALRRLGPEDYRQVLPGLDPAALIVRGLAYRPGFLVNSRELAGLVHVFATSLLDHRQIPLETLETLPVKKATEGTLIGISRYGDRTSNVCIPPDVRQRSTHVIAGSGMGKSTVMQHMFLQDIQEGKGAVFIDAHGESIQQLLGLIPETLQSRCIYFNPGDPNWIPSWNPLHIPTGGDIYRMTDDFLSAFERISKDWGDRLAHVLHNGLLGLSILEGATLLDLFHLVRQRSVESEALRTRIVQLAVDDPVRKFWERDFLKDYREMDLASPKHKLHRLLAGGSVSLMLSQPHSAIQFRKIMDEAWVLLADLSALGSETKEVLGALMLTLFMMAAMSRIDTQASARGRFSIFADEAHLFVSADAIENLITQARKFCINLCLAHQYLTQFKSTQVDALSTVGTTILGRVNRHDSRFFANDLQELVDPKELVSLEPYEMIARINNEVVRVRTLPLSNKPNEQVRQSIIERSRRQFCIPAAEVRRLIANRSEGGFSPTGGDAGGFKFKPEDLKYDEF